MVLRSLRWTVSRNNLKMDPVRRGEPMQPVPAEYIEKVRPGYNDQIHPDYLEPDWYAWPAEENVPINQSRQWMHEEQIRTEDPLLHRHWHETRQALEAARASYQETKQLETRAFDMWNDFLNRPGARELSQPIATMVNDRIEELVHLETFRRERKEARDQEMVAALARAKNKRLAVEREAQRIQNELHARLREEENLLRYCPPPLIEAAETMKEGVNIPQEPRRRSPKPTHRRIRLGRSRTRSRSPGRPIPNSADPGFVRNRQRREELVEHDERARTPRNQPVPPNPDVAGKPRPCYYCGHPGVRIPNRCPNAWKHDLKNPWFHRKDQ